MPAPPVPAPLADDVLDDDMLHEALGASVDFSSTTAVDLSFRRIRYIENLQGLNKVMKLCLSNNRLTDIENIAHLATLEIVDLSFNNITHLSNNLRALKRLRELSLFSNHITDLGEIPELSSLLVLNVGACKISDIKSFLPLRKLKGLRSLTAKDNPCAKDKRADEYRAYILAYLGRMLRYFDYRVVDSENVVACREQFQNELETLEATEAARAAEQRQIEAEKVSHAALQNIYMLEAVTLFDTMMKGDVELQKIDKMEGLSDLKESLRKSLTEAVETVRLNMQKRVDEIEFERSSFLTALEEVYGATQAWSINRMKQLSRKAKTFFVNDLSCSQPPRVEFVGNEEPDWHVCEQKLRALKGEVGKTRAELESHELESQGMSFRLLDTFEDNYSLKMTALIEIMQEFFQKATNFGNAFHESLKNLAVAAVTNYAEEQADVDQNKEADPNGGIDGDHSSDEEGLSDDEVPVDAYSILLSSTDTMMEVVNGSHERHETIILNCDEVVRSAIKQDLALDLKKYKEKEFSRGRNVMKEIVDTCTGIEKSAVEALKVAKGAFED